MKIIQGYSRSTAREDRLFQSTLMTRVQFSTMRYIVAEKVELPHRNRSSLSDFANIIKKF